jgi:hypothetical protein
VMETVYFYKVSLVAYEHMSQQMERVSVCIPFPKHLLTGQDSNLGILGV